VVFLVKDFDRIDVIQEIEGVLRNETRLHIGGGEPLTPGQPVDRSVIKMKVLRENEVVSIPYIPGSSLKGVLRSLAERFAKSMEEDIAKSVCDPLDIVRREREREQHEKNPCIVCQIFGNTGVVSHVTVFDCLPEGEKNPPTEIKPGIGIHRVLRSVYPRLLFSEEYVSPGVRWSFRIRIVNIDLDDDNDARSKLLRMLLKELVEGRVQIGGRKSVGSGLIKLLASETKIRKFKLENGELKKVFEKTLEEWMQEKGLL